MVGPFSGPKLFFNWQQAPPPPPFKAVDLLVFRCKDIQSIARFNGIDEGLTDVDVRAERLWDPRKDRSVWIYMSTLYTFLSTCKCVYIETTSGGVSILLDWWKFSILRLHNVLGLAEKFPTWQYLIVGNVRDRLFGIQWKENRSTSMQTSPSNCEDWITLKEGACRDILRGYWSSNVSRAWKVARARKFNMTNVTCLEEIHLPYIGSSQDLRHPASRNYKMTIPNVPKPTISDCVSDCVTSLQRRALRHKFPSVDQVLVTQMDRVLRPRPRPPHLRYHDSPAQDSAARNSAYLSILLEDDDKDIAALLSKVANEEEPEDEEEGADDDDADDDDGEGKEGDLDYDDEASVHDIPRPEVYDSDIAYLNDFEPAEPGSNLFLHPVQMSPTEEIDSNNDPSYFSDDYIDFRELESQVSSVEAIIYDEVVQHEKLGMFPCYDK